ncbi:hypothetical protein [Enterobacter asburiae]|uniref:hypothetical protein n=1 Tax=Enterobacter asburiae TaxID=61645 RepID=UPI002A81ED51|nr:hypothetical protein [Enterobacter asburiae]
MTRTEFAKKITNIFSSIDNTVHSLQYTPPSSIDGFRIKSFIVSLEKISENLSLINKYNFYSNPQAYSSEEKNEVSNLINSIEKYLSISDGGAISEEALIQLKRIGDETIKYARIAHLISSFESHERLSNSIENKFNEELQKIQDIKNEIEASVVSVKSMLKSSANANEKIIELTNSLKDENLKAELHSSQIEAISNKSKSLYSNIENINEILNNAEISLKTISSKYNLHYEQIENLADTSKEKIQSILNSADEVTKLKQTISSELAVSHDLLAKAKSALNLSGTYRLSRHFKSAYELANKNKIIWACITVISSLICMLFIGYVLYEMHVIGSISQNTQNTHLILLFVARLSMIPILLGFFAFSAMQYVKQNNISEDYAHKKLLSETLISFKQEIERNGSDKVSIFMDGILKYLLNSPLNTSDKKSHQLETK